MSAKANILVNLKGAKQAQSQMKALGGHIENNISRFVSFGVAAAVLGKIAKDAFKLAAEAEGVERAFKRLNRPGLLQNLQQATRGTVSNLELMKQAVRAENFNIPLTQMGTLLKFAQQRAIDTGESVDYLVNSIIMGIGRKSPMILDNLGISIIKVREEFAKTGNMAEAVGNIAKEELEKMGGGAETTAEKLAKISAQWENIQLSLGNITTDLVSDSGVLEAFSDYISDAADNLWNLISPLSDYGKIEKEINVELNTQVEQVEKVVSAYEKWKLEKLVAIEKEKELAEWTKKLNMELIEQAGLLSGGTMPEETLTTHLWSKGIEASKAYGVESVKATKKADKAYDEIMSKYNGMANIANQFSSMWSQALLSQWNEGKNFFDNMVTGFRQMLAAMAAELLAKAAIFGIFNLITGGGFGAAQGGLEKFLGFAGGGSFTVGGSGGTDSQMVAFKATPGERVIVQTPEQQVTNNSPTIIFNNPIMDQRYTEQMIIPMIKKAIARGN